MDDAAFELLQMVIQLERSTYARSLFQVSVECRMAYSWAWEVLRRAEVLGYVSVERKSPPKPLVITSTERGRSLVALKVSGKSPKWQEAPI